ncbi:MAG: ABC transporter ATP-binding protein [Clostridium sp.]|jgi:ABC-type taurine transport system ATPase subunit|uniref:ABC transporter ATP-binding protein n=1 Tax=Clostridium sp. TaxID=1506 RepID=UPI0025BFB987|nr:ABC transporter ATP-binding protein [Clostridium sp.]MCH3963740.1 ABC transporter ATP-binding protein [Clostridium sp.]MCI1714881.1 ABC transporter ATP-binding protein [Clostridium sp.]MCI1798930.1 ABC transporter ATP-binding protein [Clostridium sp.]MCI1813064.1 ABC transporter ATP-binding protein [Clostridium sp.]MCI1869954.1 ABC transporter ATP-binding protein [Clostridium sp.]
MSSIELLSEYTCFNQKSAEANISLENISLNYNQPGKEFRALENINLQLCSDDFVCVLGPSGCGKSSLLNIIAGYLKPSKGNVFIDGNPHTRPDPQVGVVFQQPSLLPWLNIQKNIEFGLKMKGVSKLKRTEIASHYLELVGLQDYNKSYPHQLSGGMKQRAAIARTLAADPKIILLDEPFSALDALTREKMQKHLYFIWQQTRKCLFFITHDVDEALLLGNRIIIMHSNPGRIVKEYKNPLVRSGGQNFRTLRSQKEFFEMREYLIDQIQEDDEEKYE